MLKFEIQAKVKSDRARAGVIETPHGKIETPAFIPVATKATVKSLTPELVRDDVQAQAILANTYHLYLQPGTDILEKAGGLGKFMNWKGPTFTDSGGFQAFSLGGKGKAHKSKIDIKRPLGVGLSATPKTRPEGRADGGQYETSGTKRALIDEEIPMAKVTEEGVAFKSIIDGSSHTLTPELSIEIQHKIGADIIFAFDECLLPAESYERQKEAVGRTTRWAERCLIEHRRSAGTREFPRARGLSERLEIASAISGASSAGPEGTSLVPALFGIVQGGRHEDLRRMSARQISAMDFDGFGIGGSFDKQDIGTAVGWVCDELPEAKLRHLLGIGSEPVDLILGIKNGVDTFDCVAPSRMARNGGAYVSGRRARINLNNAEFVNDFGPLDSDCACYTCRNYSRAYLSHLFRAKEMLAATLVTIHNLFFVVDLVKKARESIIRGDFEKWSSEKLSEIS